MLAWGFLVTAAKVSAVYVLFKVIIIIKSELRLHLRHVPGPESESFLWGNMGSSAGEEDKEAIYEKWAKEYGNTFKFKLLWMVRYSQFCIWMKWFADAPLTPLYS
jgi:hypothetical protein